MDYGGGGLADIGTDVFTIHHILYMYIVHQANPYNTTQNQIRNSVLTTLPFSFSSIINFVLPPSWKLHLWKKNI